MDWSTVKVLIDHIPSLESLHIAEMQTEFEEVLLRTLTPKPSEPTRPPVPCPRLHRISLSKAPTFNFRVLQALVTSRIDLSQKGEARAIEFVRFDSLYALPEYEAWLRDTVKQFESDDWPEGYRYGGQRI